MAFVHRKGRQELERYPLDSSTDAITVGMAITSTGATAGYFQNVDGSGDQVEGFAVDRASVPSSDGLTYVTVDISYDTTYEAPPDAGTVTTALIGKTMDVGADGLSVNIDASATDDLICVQVDTVANTLFVKRNKAAAPGVA